MAPVHGNTLQLTHADMKMKVLGMTCPADPLDHDSVGE